MNTAQVDAMRLEVSRSLCSTRKTELGQFMTPVQVSDFMASLFDESSRAAKLLDCGAGIGSLTLSSIKMGNRSHLATASCI
jgi:adenine-specific DNA-methyltransferase